MSAGTHTVALGARSQRPRRRAVADSDAGTRPWIRLASFAALGLYGVQRWATLLRPVPGWRLLGLLGLAVALAGGVPYLRRRHRPAAPVMAAALMALALPVAGLRWHWFVHVRIAVSANRIGNGLEALPNSLVPYLGTSHAIRLVIVLGAALLLLDAAAVMAFAPNALGDARRAVAALPLVALAVVPSTIVRPEFPYLQGLALFVLLAAFMWGERLRRDMGPSALTLVALAGIAGAIVAPRIDQHRPWVDYRAWAGTLVPRHIDTFDWNQSYGPLHWPRSGHAVLTVTAKAADYWKAEDLGTFDGVAWKLGTQTNQPALPPPAESARARWTQSIRVTVEGMRSTDVIAAGYAAQPTAIAGGFAEGADPGTWVAGRALGPGSSYAVSTYSPHPSGPQLIGAGRSYPWAALRNDLTLTIPAPSRLPAAAAPQVTFASFHSAAVPYRYAGKAFLPSLPRLVRESPYGRAYALARRLAAGAATPYGFVTSVERYLSRGYTYDEKPPVRRFPLASFLFTDKRGYCQQFSGAMAMLLRMGGIPARIAAGFTSGTVDATAHQWVATDIDAHAWVEVWFPRYGWVRFDPTPASAPARGGNSAAELVKTFGGLGKGAPVRAHGLNAVAPAQSSPTRRRSAGATGPWRIVAVLMALVVMAAVLRVLRKPGASSDELLAELERALSRTRRPLSDEVTLASLERRFGASPGAAGYVRLLRLARYGGDSALPSSAQRRALRRELALGLGLVGRVRALWALPPRLRAPAKAGRRGLDS